MNIARLLIALSLALCTTLGAKDMQAYLQQTVELANAGKYEEALGRHVWFHYHALEHQPSMSGVRLSFALNYWKDLGKKYPPALEKLKAIRDEKEALIESGEGSFKLFHDVSSINRELDEDQRTLELFKEVETTQPEQSERFWIVMKDTAFHYKDYELISKYIPDIEQEYRELYSGYLRDYRMFQKDAHRDWARKRFQEGSQQLVDLAMHKHDAVLATKIKQRTHTVLESKDGIID